MAARPEDAPVRANFANAFVISIKFWLTLGALDSSDINCRIDLASKGMFSIAFVELLYPSCAIPFAKFATCSDVLDTFTELRLCNPFPKPTIAFAAFEICPLSKFDIFSIPFASLV